MTSSKGARRVSLKVEAAPNSLDAKLVAHVKKDPITPSREVTLRALKAFYLPWALEGEVSDEDLKAIAQSAIEELQFRIFQIRQRYLNTESSGYKPASAASFASNGATNLASPPPEASIEAMREAINPADLDDF